VNDHPPRILGIPNRYLILLLIILQIVTWRIIAPVLPHIQVAPEKYPGYEWTNTMSAMVFADIVLLLIALAVKRAVSSGSMVPQGFSGVIEAIIEVIYNLTESTAGRFTKKIFPYFATITLLVLVVNWTELIPGVDSIGFLEESDHGHPVQQVMPGVFTITNDQTGGHDEEVAAVDEAHAEADDAHAQGFALIPYVRVLSTDLNFTVALALISVIMTQVIGVQSLGFKYFEKFINVTALINFFKKPMGIIDFFVGILEIVSEFSKIISFSFRLFGNIFAGSVLLFVIGTLLPVVAQSVFLMLELFVGVIQALVFGMLTMVFMTQAASGHGDHEEEHAH
jgi:F-type H+-transporting ATPase subunit a